VVTAVGPDVTAWRPGDEVIVFRAEGTYASALDVPEGALTKKPASVSWEQAAGLLLVGATAVHALEATHVGTGDVVVAQRGGVGGAGPGTADAPAWRSGDRDRGGAQPRAPAVAGCDALRFVGEGHANGKVILLP
jgi:hypothetical protein